MRTPPFALVHRAANEAAEHDVVEARELAAKAGDLLAEIDALCAEPTVAAKRRRARTAA